MARIRSVHPGLWTDEAFVSCSAPARLLFIGILNECDDQGAFEWKPVTLKMRLAPADNVHIPGLMEELARVNLIKRYNSCGCNYGAVRHFRQWQRPKKPNLVHPMPEELRNYSGLKNGSSPPDTDEEPPSSPPVPAQLPTSGEKPPQMEEGGDKGRRLDGKKERPFASLTPSAGAEVVDHFEEFWQAYPRKVGKGAARKAWRLALKKADDATIIGAIGRQQWSADERYQPHAATWLNRESWLDQADTFDPVLRAAGLTPEDMTDDEFPAIEGPIH